MRSLLSMIVVGMASVAFCDVMLQGQEVAIKPLIGNLPISTDIFDQAEKRFPRAIPASKSDGGGSAGIVNDLRTRYLAVLQQPQSPASGAAPPPPVTTKKPPVTAINGAAPTAATTQGPAPPSMSFADAIKQITNPADPNYPSTPQPSTGFCSDGSTQILVHSGGGASQSRLGRQGKYCFVLDQVNLPLYDYAFTGVVPAVVQSPIDILESAASIATGFTVSGAGGGSPSTPVPTPASGTCSVALDGVTSAASQFSRALTLIDPGKDSNGKVNGSVLYVTTKAAFDKSVTPSFRSFEREVGLIIASMGTDPSAQPNCSDTFPKAQTIVFNYLQAREQYLTFLGKINTSQEVMYEQTLQPYEPFVLTESISYSGAATNVANQTFSFDPSYSLISSSVGFMVTELPSRSYTSGTAPNPTSPTTSTEDVLVVNGLKGLRPTIDALLNVNVPELNNRNCGLALSVGPVFDISNGKASTSNFGLFGGISVRVTDYLYITPGFHFGQFADFPQGYTAAGQVIPPNSGTPTPVTRYTARFGISLSFKVKDLYSPKATSSAKSGGSTSPTSTPTTTTAKPANPTSPATKTKPG